MEACKEANVPEQSISELQLEKRQESEGSGISLAYIMSDEFAQRARQATGLEDPSFYEMKDPFFIKGASRIGGDKRCPRDLREGCSFVDSLPAGRRKKATHFLSWVWRYKLSVLVSALKCWLEATDQKPEEVFLWVCFFCNNQWRLLVEKSAQGSENLEEIFKSRLSDIGQMVAVMDQWQDSVYIERIWTIYEQYVATNLGIPMTFTLPKKPSESLLAQLDKGKAGMMDVIQAISKVDAENAKASVQEDEDYVKGIIRNTIGFDKVNRQVKKSISQWIAQTFKTQIDNMVQTMDNMPEESRSQSFSSCRQS